MTKSKRLKAVAEELSSALAAKSLPGQQIELENLADKSLFTVDVEGAVTAATAKAAAKTSAKDSASRRKRLHPDTLKKIETLASSITKGETKKPKPADDIITDYEKPVLRDFWSNGEAGLPPAPSRTVAELKGKDPSKVINEWNIHATPRISANRTRKFHERNKKATAPALVPLHGLSYNPTAGDHAEAITALAKVQNNLTREKKKRTDYSEYLAKLREDIKAKEEAKTEDGEEDDGDDHDVDEDATEEQVEDSEASAERKTRTQRHKEERVKALQVEEALKSKEKKFLHDLNSIKKITKEIDRAEQERKERLEKWKTAVGKGKVAKPKVVINGKKIPAEKMLGSNPLPAVLPPSQLPDNMRRIPGVGGIIEEEYLALRMKNVVESGRAKARGKRESKLKKSRNVNKFDLDTMTNQVVQPRFKVPEKLKTQSSESVLNNSNRSNKKKKA